MITWRETYRPYGDRLAQWSASANNKLWFAGKSHDASTGLTYMGARYYDPTIGRFVGVDPAQVDLGNLHSFNRYTYANNNPNKYVDPDGRTGVLVWARPSYFSLNRFPSIRGAMKDVQRQAPFEARGPSSARYPIKQPFESKEAYALRREAAQGGPYKESVRHPDPLPRVNPQDLAEAHILTKIGNLLSELLGKGSAPPVSATGTESDEADDLETMRLLWQLEHAQEKNMPPDPCRYDSTNCMRGGA